MTEIEKVPIQVRRRRSSNRQHHGSGAYCRTSREEIDRLLNWLSELAFQGT